MEARKLAPFERSVLLLLVGVRVSPSISSAFVDPFSVVGRAARASLTGIRVRSQAHSLSIPPRWWLHSSYSYLFIPISPLAGHFPHVNLGTQFVATQIQMRCTTLSLQSCRVELGKTCDQIT